MQANTTSAQYLTSHASTAARPARTGLLHRLMATTDDPGAALARVALAVVMFPHGAQKLLGWFGGYGPAATFDFLNATMGLAAPIAVLVIAIEFAAPLLLLAGLGARAAALGIAAVMVGAVATVHAPYGFFMNWSGAQAGEGFEYHLLALGLAGVVLIRGAGRWSLDRVASRRHAADA